MDGQIDYLIINPEINLIWSTESLLVEHKHETFSLMSTMFILQYIQSMATHIISAMNVIWKSKANIG